jgi:hypothetical protein
LASDYDLASVFKDLNFKGSSVVGSLISSSIGLASAGTTMASSALKNTGATDKLFGSTQLVGGFQDDIFNPILIILIYDKYKNLIFPINPEEFTINTPSNSQIKFAIYRSPQNLFSLLYHNEPKKQITTV